MSSADLPLSTFSCESVDCSVGSTPNAPVAAYTVGLGGSAVSDVDCGSDHTCVLVDKGTINAAIKCFGDNSKYQLVSDTFFRHH
jgi:Regulator of chromosome condensation (RCC1) repeat